MYISKLRRARLRLFGNHERRCPHRARWPRYDKCRCTLWVDGSIDGKRYSRSLGTRNVDVAWAMVREIEESDPDEIVEVRTKTLKPESMTILSAKNIFLSECRTRNLNGNTIYKYNLLLNRL